MCRAGPFFPCTLCTHQCRRSSVRLAIPTRSRRERSACHIFRTVSSKSYQDQPIPHAYSTTHGHAIPRIRVTVCEHGFIPLKDICNCQRSLGRSRRSTSRVSQRIRACPLADFKLSTLQFRKVARQLRTPGRSCFVRSQTG